MKLTEKQKNCPYCHDPFPSVPLFGGNILLRIAEDGGEYVFNVECNGDPEDVGILSFATDGQAIIGCPFCRRPLNEEEE